MEKKCNICDSVKDITEFYKNQTRCKLCTKQYALDNKKRIKEYKTQYRVDNIEKVKQKDKEYYNNNKEKIRENHKQYYLENTDKVKEIQKKYRENNVEILSMKSIEYSKRYRDKNKNDNLYRIKRNLRGSLRHFLKNKGMSKLVSTETILGCSFEDFLIHLESQFKDWMQWENYGKYNGELDFGWDIDHIKPLSSAESEDDVYDLNHYTNLQPLCSKVNRYVKMSKY